MIKISLIISDFGFHTCIAACRIRLPCSALVGAMDCLLSTVCCMENTRALTHAFIIYLKNVKKKRKTTNNNQTKTKHYGNCVWMLPDRTEVNTMSESVLEKFQNACRVFRLVDCCVGFVGLFL